MRILLGLLLCAIFICSFTLILSIYPGVLGNLLTLIAVGSLWLGLILGLAIAAITRFHQNKSFVPIERRRLTAILLILVVSYALLKFYVPRRIAFSLSRPAFEQWSAAHPGETNQPQGVNTRLGVYQVDQYFAGSQEDRYFRVYQHGDGLGPDTVSYGFAYRPSVERTPFGAANYGIYSLGNDWYWFRASNDW